MLISANFLLEAIGMSQSVPLHKRGGIPWRPATYCDCIIAMCEELNLIDISRKKNPTANYLHMNPKWLKMKSRIDLFLIANSMSYLVSHVNIGISIVPDHRAVRLNVTLTSNKWGPWKFNNSLLLDDEFVSLIKTSYLAIRGIFCELDDKQLLKMGNDQDGIEEPGNSRDYPESFESNGLLKRKRLSN